VTLAFTDESKTPVTGINMSFYNSSTFVGYGKTDQYGIVQFQTPFVQPGAIIIMETADALMRY